MSGVASETGSMSPTMVAKIVIDNIMVTPEMGQQRTADSVIYLKKGVARGRFEMMWARGVFAVDVVFHRLHILV